MIGYRTLLRAPRARLSSLEVTTIGPSRTTRTANITILSNHLSDEDSEWNVLGNDIDIHDTDYKDSVYSNHGYSSFYDSPEHHHRPTRPTIAPIFVNQPTLKHADCSRGSQRRKETGFGKVLRKFGSRILIGFYYNSPRRQRRGKTANFWPEGVIVRKNHTRKEY